MLCVVADIAAVKLENKGDLEMFYSEQQVWKFFDLPIIIFVLLFSL